MLDGNTELPKSLFFCHHVFVRSSKLQKKSQHTTDFELESISPSDDESRIFPLHLNSCYDTCAFYSPWYILSRIKIYINSKIKKNKLKTNEKNTNETWGFLQCSLNKMSLNIRSNKLFSRSCNDLLLRFILFFHWWYYLAFNDLTFIWNIWSQKLMILL